MADSSLRYLPREDVIAATKSIDVVEIVRQALVLHADGRTTLPNEAHLPWETEAGSAARSLALPGALWGDRPVVGLKVINSSLANTGRGLSRAQGVTLLFDRNTAHPVALLEAAYVSALRTAAYTAVSVLQLASASVVRVGLIGCGPVGIAHGELLHAMFPGVSFALFDVDPDHLAAADARLSAGGIACQAEVDAKSAVEGCDVVVTATTATRGYVPYGWLAPGALVAHVSLDDVLPDVVARADVVVVDDWDLVRNDSRRLLGRLCRSGQLVGPAERLVGPVPMGARAIDGTLGDVITGRHPGRRRPEDIILSNPFGMGILDVAIAAEVLSVAERYGLGIELPL